MRRVGWAFALALASFAFLNGLASAADPVVTDLRIEAGDDLTVGDRFLFFLALQAGELRETAA
jgi:hypothetical protein